MSVKKNKNFELRFTAFTKIWIPNISLHKNMNSKYQYLQLLQNYEIQIYLQLLQKYELQIYLQFLQKYELQISIFTAFYKNMKSKYQGEQVCSRAFVAFRIPCHACIQQVIFLFCIKLLSWCADFRKSANTEYQL